MTTAGTLSGEVYKKVSSNDSELDDSNDDPSESHYEDETSDQAGDQHSVSQLTGMTDYGEPSDRDPNDAAAAAAEAVSNKMAPVQPSDVRGDSTARAIVAPKDQSKMLRDVDPRSQEQFMPRRVYDCNICGWRFALKGNLSAHLRRHTGEKPYVCGMCNRRFTQSSSLTVHSRTHTGEKPFACPRCNRTFSRSGNLTTHLRTHTDSKPYACGFCNKRFSQRVNMESHTRIHTGVKPYQCGVCERKFSSCSNMRRHWRQLHPNHPEPALGTSQSSNGMPEKMLYADRDIKRAPINGTTASAPAMTPASAPTTVPTQAKPTSIPGPMRSTSIDATVVAHIPADSTPSHAIRASSAQGSHVIGTDPKMVSSGVIHNINDSGDHGYSAAEDFELDEEAKTALASNGAITVNGAIFVSKERDQEIKRNAELSRIRGKKRNHTSSTVQIWHPDGSSGRFQYYIPQGMSTYFKPGIHPDYAQRMGWNYGSRDGNSGNSTLVDDKDFPNTPRTVRLIDSHTSDPLPIGALQPDPTTETIAIATTESHGTNGGLSTQEGLVDDQHTAVAVSCSNGDFRANADSESISSRNKEDNIELSSESATRSAHGDTALDDLPKIGQLMDQQQEKHKFSKSRNSERAISEESSSSGQLEAISDRDGSINGRTASSTAAPQFAQIAMSLPPTWNQFNTLGFYSPAHFSPDVMNSASFNQAISAQSYPYGGYQFPTMNTLPTPHNVAPGLVYAQLGQLNTMYSQQVNASFSTPARPIVNSVPYDYKAQAHADSPTQGNALFPQARSDEVDPAIKNDDSDAVSQSS